MGVNGCNIGFMLRSDTLQITPEILSLIARIDEFKGAWRALGTLAPERLLALRRVATIESIGSSTRIEGSKLTDREVQRLLSNLAIKSFDTRDEQEVAGYAELMDMVFSSWQDIPFNENHIKQLHQVLLTHSEKDARHRGQYKTHSNSVAAFDENGTQIGIDLAPEKRTLWVMAPFGRWCSFVVSWCRASEPSASIPSPGAALSVKRQNLLLFLTCPKPPCDLLPLVLPRPLTRYVNRASLALWKWPGRTAPPSKRLRPSLV